MFHGNCHKIYVFMQLCIRLGFKVLYILIVFLFHHVIYGVKVIPIRERESTQQVFSVNYRRPLAGGHVNGQCEPVQSGLILKKIPNGTHNLKLSSVSRDNDLIRLLLAVYVHWPDRIWRRTCLGHDSPKNLKKIILYMYKGRKIRREFPHLFIYSLLHSLLLAISLYSTIYCNTAIIIIEKKHTVLDSIIVLY